jgi:hypothetical protein
MGRRFLLVAFAAMTLVLAGSTVTAAPPAEAAEPGTLWFDGSPVTVRAGGFADGYGREVVLRGFNVAGQVKLAERGNLPFGDAADAATSATAMRTSTGANAVRFLLSWEAAQPAPGTVDATYLRRVAEQVKPFLDRGFQVFFDYHQDLYSRHLFNAGSWYTGDGAPRWVVAAGGYPREFCGICVQWGQNITQNAAVQAAMYDFWHNRVLTTDAGPVAVQDAFLAQAEATMGYLRDALTPEQFSSVLGVDPWNEPYAGRYDAGQDSRSWERNLLLPFHSRFRAAMDAAGWQDKPLFAEPGMFWDANLSFVRQPGGFLDAGTLGPRYVFNAHFYDQRALSGIFLPGKAKDGQYSQNFDEVRQRGAALGTATIISEYGHPVTGNTSDKAPTILKAMYQALDSAVPGAGWWASAGRSGAVLSGTQWQWDIYSGRHAEAMNGNPRKVQTTGDAWNGEDFSQVRIDATGGAVLRSDERLLDRVYPLAVSGRTVAFTYEDRARDGSTTLTWNRIPASLPAVTRLVGTGRYAVLVWRAGSTNAPTELSLPRSFDAAATTVVTDVAAVTGLPAYSAQGTVADAPVAVASRPGGGRRIVLSPTAADGATHVALVTDGASAPPAELLEQARAELTRWSATVAP